MKKLFFTLLVLLSSFPLLAQNYDLIVAKDGSGNYTSIQEAINAIRDYKPEGRQRILVRKGVYEEKVIVPSYKTNISLIGEDADSTILVWHDHAAMRTASGFPGFSLADERQAQADAVASKGRKIGTFQSYTLRVDGPGFECENMTITNDAMTYWNPSWRTDRQSADKEVAKRANAAGVAQAVSVHVEADRVVFRNCRLLGFQDTLFTGNEDGREIFYHCYIEGTVDFIFGPATCWFEECELHAITNGYLTAASTPAHHPFGYVFYRCKVTAGELVTSEWLGRPWRNAAAVTFYECELPAVINPLGWHNWNDPAREATARYREYKSTGPGADISKRVPWSRQLTREEANLLATSQGGPQSRYVMTRRGYPWTLNYRPVDFYSLHFFFFDEYKQKGVRYAASTLEPKTLPAHPETAVEDLVVNLEGVDCTTLVEYLSAAMLGRCTSFNANDSIFRRFVQALRYRDGRRGNYASRKHYFSDWIRDNERQGMMTEITASIPKAKSQQKKINFMSVHTDKYPQLAASDSLLRAIKAVEEELSAQTTWYVPKMQVRKITPYLQEGDIVAFVTNTAGLDVSHVGFIFLRDPKYDEPQVLHASSSMGSCQITPVSLFDYASSIPSCVGVRIIRLNNK